MNQRVLPSGTVLQSRYRIEHLIARGGMGAVYQATDMRLGSVVALKQIIIDHPRLHKAFEREARLLAGLRHPALPVVSDYFSDEAGRFLVMQYIAGDDLGTVLDRQPDAFTPRDSVATVLQWADQLLDALDYLHTREPPIIHRDIKPQNLKLTPRGEIVLLDFGLAKNVVADASSTSGQSVRAYTTDYAPFEQIQGTGTDARSDIYSLAATLYHLLTGRTPASSLTRAVAVLGGKPDPLEPAHLVNPRVPPTVAVVLHEAMANGIGKRFTSAAAMRAALRSSRTAVQTDANMVIPAAVAIPLNSSGMATIVNTPEVLIPQPVVASPTIAIEPAVTTTEPEPDVRHTQAAITQVPVAPVLIVGQDEQSLYHSIGAAIANAQPGSRIVVRPGIYRETVIIDRAVEIVGDGRTADIVVECTDASCLIMRADYGVVRGLTLRSMVSSLDDEDQAAVDIPQGRLILERCDIATSARVGVLIRG
ncbi:MAG: protein kinase [Chloroflexaceae bacterium]|nr:protein kinase [Chloroflexaceae bacterium]